MTQLMRWRSKADGDTIEKQGKKGVQDDGRIHLDLSREFSINVIFQSTNIY